MGMLDRYKKKGGFIQLVNLIETTGLEKRERFLKMISDENPSWEVAIKQKMISLERMAKWELPYIMEFLNQIPGNVVAYAVYPLPPEIRTKILSSLQYVERKKAEELLTNYKPNPGEIASSQIKIINEIRGMTSSGKIKFDKFDKELAIPENFEDQIENNTADLIVVDQPISDATAAAVTSGSTASSTTAPSTSSAAANGSAAEEITLLRRKLVSLTQENTRLAKENNDLKAKLSIVKEAFVKIA